MRHFLSVQPDLDPQRPPYDSIRMFATRHTEAVLLSIASLLSAERWLRYIPVHTEDSSEYLRLGHAIAQGRFFAVDNGFRTPLFPLYLALLANRPTLVFAGHLVFGIAICLLLYHVFRDLTGRAGIGVAAALLYLLLPSTLYYQCAVLTETLAALCVSLGAYFAVKACHSRAKVVRNTVLASLAFSIASLDRADYQLLPPLVVIVLAAFARLNGNEVSFFRRALRSVLAGLGPWVLLVLGWSFVNYVRFGWFTLSTLPGYQLTQYAGPYFNEVAPPDRAVADVFFQDEQVFAGTHHGRRIDAIWQARPHLLAATGLNDTQLSRALVRISLRLILAHPKSYLSAVWRSWQIFWRPPLYPRGLNLPDLRRALQGVLAGRTSWWQGLYAYLYALFDLAYAAAVVGPFIRKAWRPILWSPGMLCLDIIILYTAFITSLFGAEDNNRYKMPVEGMILGVAITMAWVILSDLRQCRRGGTYP